MGAARPLVTEPTVLQPARTPDRAFAATRVLSHRDGVRWQGGVFELDDLLRPGDLLVLNDSATLPASLWGRVAGAAIELRLAGIARDGTSDATDASFPARWQAVAFGPGSWRDDTDLRPPPPPPAPGDRIALGGTFGARVESADGRLVTLRFDRDGDALAQALYACGRPVQYRHLERALRLSEVQTPYAARPWSVEMPSTGRPLRLALLRALRSAGVEIAWLTHAAGLSATGSRALDARLPFDERFAIPEATLRAVERTRGRGGRVLAVGTTVVRALEASAAQGLVREGWATERITAASELQLVDGLLTGVHSPGESHWELLSAFAPADALSALHRDAIRSGLLAHEFGDLLLV